MSIVMDKKSLRLPAALDNGTIGESLKWAQNEVPAGRVVVKIELDGVVLEGPALAHCRRDPVGKGVLTLTTADRKDLSLTTLGKLAALIEWLAPQHKDVAAMLERGESQRGLDRLGQLLSAWQEIQNAYGNLAKMLEISLAELRVNELTGESTLNEFCRQLGEVQTALQNQDFVLLSDILQYEMDGAVANWMALLEATLGVVEPVPA